MGRRRQGKTRTVNNLTINSIATEGKGLGRDENGKVIFVDYAIPGDVVDAFVYQSKKDVGIGRIDRLIDPSNLRIEPFCEHFYTCGGCRWQHVSYEQQLKFKHQIVQESFSRIAKVNFPTIPSVVGSEKTTYYRNKLEYTFSNNRWLTKEQINSKNQYDKEHALGFHVPKFYDKIVDIQHCYLQEDPSNAIRLAIREYAIKHNLSFFDIRKKEGFLRNLIIRNTTLGEWMVIVVFYQNLPKEINGLMAHIQSQFPEITSLQYVINEKKNEIILDREVFCYHGKDHIIEQLGHTKFKIGPKSFFQTNSQQAEVLYQITAKFAKLTGQEIVYDLFTGTGSIANYLANKAKKVVGIEIVPEAIEDAKENAEINNNKNCFFYAGKVENLFSDELLNEHGKADVIILDPPRAGIHNDVVAQLLKLQVETIVYVSCNPATQARDVAMLDEMYTVSKIQPVDLFPHTFHIENVIQLKKRL